MLEDFGIRLKVRAPVHCLVKDGNPADAIAEAIAENHPCILVAGVKRASGTPGPHGTAFALLSASRVPVLCVPPDNERAESEREVAASGGHRVIERQSPRAGPIRFNTGEDGRAKGETAPFCPTEIQLQIGM